MHDGTPLISPGDKNSDGGDSFWKPLSLLLRRPFFSVFQPFADPSGSLESVKSGLTIIFLGGSAIGICMPKNLELPGALYRLFSSAIGYIYFLAWSVSFYPQIISNYKQKSTEGLSNDFSVINLVGYMCYTLYTASFYWSKSIEEEYQQRHGPDAKITVQSNDVAFAVHALVLSFVWIAQIYYYRGFERQSLSFLIRFLIIAIFLICSLFALLVIFQIGHFEWIDFMYLLSFFKVMITVSKYLPQVLLNAKRKSTEGWSVWTVTLDITGGILSLLQLAFDSMAMKDWTGVTGNLAKLALSFVTIFFDIIFLVQHYVLYH